MSVRVGNGLLIANIMQPTKCFVFKSDDTIMCFPYSKNRQYMFKIIWDTEGNGVKLTMSSKGDAINVSPRPVSMNFK